MIRWYVLIVFCIISFCMGMVIDRPVQTIEKQVVVNKQVPVCAPIQDMKSATFYGARANVLAAAIPQSALKEIRR